MLTTEPRKEPEMAGRGGCVLCDGCTAHHRYPCAAGLVCPNPARRTSPYSG